jgi:hypothetical protein
MSDTASAGDAAERDVCTRRGSAEHGEIAPIVTLHTTTYPLDNINDALADLDQGRLQGRGILIPEAAQAAEGSISADGCSEPCSSSISTATSSVARLGSSPVPGLRA